MQEQARGLDVTYNAQQQENDRSMIPFTMRTDYVTSWEADTSGAEMDTTILDIFDENMQIIK